MDFSKANRKKLFKWFFYLFIIWLATEVIYQIRIRSEWVKNGYYNWEGYAFNRNKQNITELENYFKRYNKNYFLFSQNPNDGSLATLPNEIEAIIVDLKNDLIGGMDIMNTHKYFEINFQKIDTNNYILYVHSGATFKASYNGYNFDLIITNANASYHNGYQKTSFENVFINKQYNKEYRSTPFILRYNCNSYDLLILKLFR
jgi:hypothetical protein